MKRLLNMLLTLVLILSLICFPVYADNAASRVDMQATVNSEGDCFVSMNVRLRMDNIQNGLTFPLPLNATDITLNGASAKVTKNTSSLDVDLSRVADNYVGQLDLQFNYTLPEAVKVNPEAPKIEGRYQLQLTVPLLSGFEHPVEAMTFVVNMPGASMGFDPNFYSIYRQNSIGSDLSVTVSGSQIIGSSKTVLNDHEGVTMTMFVDEEMFPTVSTYIREGNPELVYILIFAGLALLYWILFLRALPLVRSRTSTPPEGITAGELGCRLTLCGGDLTMMIFTWAQLGYVLIQLDGNGRVLLHKRMDMGNERSNFENKVFRMLFGSRRLVDATSLRYAQLCDTVSHMVPNERNMYKGSSGNVKIFRALACVSQIFCGICVAMNMSAVLPLQILMAVILGIFGAVSGWLIQGIAYRNHLRGKTPVLVGFVVILIWILLGLLCGQVWIPLGCVVGQFLIGYLAAYGGRRSDLGRHDASQVLGLRHYVKHLPNDQVSRLLENDPDYFFNMAPYALALGVINPFAKAFSRRMLEQCPYIMSRIHGKRTAEEWAHLMADVADLMDYRARRLQVERLLMLAAPPVREQGEKPRKKSPPAAKPAPKKKPAPRQNKKRPPEQK